LAEVYATPERWNPNQSRESADHSIPYCIAVALTEGEVTPKQFTEEYLRDKRIHELMDIITVNPDEDFQKEFHDNPGHIPTRIVIEGEEQTFEIYESTAPGHPEDPLSDEELEEKFKSLTDPFLSNKQQHSIFDYCYNIDEKSDVKTLQEKLII
jgi:2-methylcitrate dehydratase